MDVVVVVTGTDDVPGMLAAGVELAQRRGGRVAIVSVASRLPCLAYTTPLALGWSAQRERDVAIEEAECARAAAVGCVPRWISVESRVIYGSPREAIVRLVSGGRPGAIVMVRKRIRRPWMWRVRRLAKAVGAELHHVGGGLD